MHGIKEIIFTGAVAFPFPEKQFPFYIVNIVNIQIMFGSMCAGS